MTMPPTTEKKIIRFVVSLALFMDALDTTIINTAIPAMSHSLGVHPVDLKIALISYLLALAIFIPISGWLADKFGIKKVFMSALGIFTFASLWCGYAQTLPELTLARSLQGVGGAFMIPIGRLILLRNFQRHELVDTMSSVIMVVSLGMMLGPLAGGLITDHLSWHWIFWVNIPVGIFAIMITKQFVKSSSPQKVHRLDWPGFILFGCGLSSLIFSFADLSESGSKASDDLRIMGFALLLLLAYFWHSRKLTHPIINLRLFKIRTFKVSILANLFARLGIGGIPFLLPLLLQVALGYSAQLSGLLLVPIALGILLVKSLSLRILRVTGYKKLLLVNTFLVGLSILAFQSVQAGMPVYFIALLTFFFGILISLQYSGMNSLAYADLPAEDQSSAASIFSTMQQLSQSLGVATSALLLQYYSSFNTGLVKLTPQVFHQTFFTLGLLTFISTLIFLQLKKDDGHQMLSAPKQEKMAMH